MGAGPGYDVIAYVRDRIIKKHDEIARGEFISNIKRYCGANSFAATKAVKQQVAGHSDQIAPCGCRDAAFHKPVRKLYRSEFLQERKVEQFCRITEDAVANQFACGDHCQATWDQKLGVKPRPFPCAVADSNVKTTWPNIGDLDFRTDYQLDLWVGAVETSESLNQKTAGEHGSERDLERLGVHLASQFLSSMADVSKSAQQNCGKVFARRCKANAPAFAYSQTKAQMGF